MCKANAGDVLVGESGDINRHGLAYGVYLLFFRGIPGGVSLQSLSSSPRTLHGDLGVGGAKRRFQESGVDEVRHLVGCRINEAFYTILKSIR